MHGCGRTARWYQRSKSPRLGGVLVVDGNRITINYQNRSRLEHAW